MAVQPIVTGAELAGLLGGSPDPELCDLVARAASAALGCIVDTPADPAPWPFETHYAALGAAADAYKSIVGPGGGYQLDTATYTDAFRMSSVWLRRYEGMLGAQRAVGGMAG